MPTLAFRFLARRYHATPWDSHVNEGNVEWPPSPWRLLRALLSAGFTHEGWQEDDLPATARELIETLASHPPRYRLPTGHVTHTRHYMPIREGQKTTLVLDAFVRFAEPDAQLLVDFPVTLSPAAHELLQRLASSLGYLGRAESWVEAEVLPEPPSDAELADASPHQQHAHGNWCEPLAISSLDATSDVLYVLCPQPPADYARQRDPAVAAAVTAATASSGKKLTKAARAKLEARWPTDLLDALLARTSTQRKQGWISPPGSRTLAYTPPRRPLDTSGAVRGHSIEATPRVEAMLLALSSGTVHGRHLPQLSRCLPQAELLHRSAAHKLGDDHHSAALTGLSASGERVRGHLHVHILPLSLATSDRIDHLLLWCPMGLDGVEQAAVRRISRTWSKGHDQDLAITCVGAADLAGMRARLERGLGRRIPILGESRVWSSHTPFVAPRFIKRNRHGLVDQVQAELDARGLPPATVVEPLTREETVSRGLHRFVKRRRPGRPQPPVERSHGLRLTFAEPLRGPLALGYASHFGLGLFAADI